MRIRTNFVGSIVPIDSECIANSRYYYISVDPKDRWVENIVYLVRRRDNNKLKEGSNVNQQLGWWLQIRINGWGINGGGVGHDKSYADQM